MGIDSNLSGDDRAAAGLKLVSERRAPTGTAGPASHSGSDSTSSAAEGPAFGAAGGGGLAGRGELKAGRQLPLWMFGVLFVLFLLGYGYQTHHASQLETEVLRLRESLAKAESRLESHRTHLLEIRTGVHDLSARLESLRVLIDRDPTAEPVAPSAAPSAGQGGGYATPEHPAKP